MFLTWFLIRDCRFVQTCVLVFSGADFVVFFRNVFASYFFCTSLYNREMRLRLELHLLWRDLKLKPVEILKDNPAKMSTVGTRETRLMMERVTQTFDIHSFRIYFGSSKKKAVMSLLRTFLINYF